MCIFCNTYELQSKSRLQDAMPMAELDNYGPEASIEYENQTIEGIHSEPVLHL